MTTADYRRELPDAIAMLRRHIDWIAPSPAERRYILDLCVEGEAGECVIGIIDLACGLSAPAEWLGVKVSPGINTGVASTEELSNTPKLSTDETGALFVRLVGKAEDIHDAIEERIHNPPQFVREITRLHKRGLVILDTDEEVFILTDAEYSSQVQAPASPIRVAHQPDLDDPCVDYRCGSVIVEVLDKPKSGVSVINDGCDYTSVKDAEQDARDLLTLLADPRVRQAIADAETRAA